MNFSPALLPATTRLFCSWPEGHQRSMAKVLVIDDRPFMLRYIEHVVSRAGHNPIKARNGVEVVEALSKDEPTLVIIDIRPDKMEAAQRALDQVTSTKAIPIIIVSGLPYQSRNWNERAWKPAAMFNKPFSPTELVGTIEQLLAEAA